MLDRFRQDLRHGVRTLAASPAFTVVALLSLAAGIGVNSAIFTLADALLLRPLPVARPWDVLTVGSANSLEALRASTLVASYPEYVDIRDRTRSFEDLIAFSNVTAAFAPDAAATPKLKLGLLVSGNFFKAMGVEPTLGRSFRPDEDQVPGRDAVVVLGRTMWEQEYGSDPGVLGRTMRINGTPLTIIGVAPPAFTGMEPVVRSDFFVPLMMSPRILGDRKAGSLQARDARNLRIRGRLRRGVDQQQAQLELNALGADLQRQYPDTNRNRALFVRTELQARIATSPPDAVLVAMLSTLALAVLLVACGNVAGLLISRAPARAREMAMRLAIGAGRSRLVAQLLTESLILALAGGALGLIVGYAGVRLFRQIEIPSDLPIMLTFRMDQRALGFSFGLAVASVLVFGLLPALQITRVDLTSVIKSSDAVARGRRRWGRAVLVAAQVAVAVVLLAVATFIYRGFRQQLVAGPGYRLDHLLMMRFDPRLMRYTEEQTQKFFDEVAERAREVTGVESVTLTTAIPMSNDSIDALPIAPEGFQFPPGRDSVTTLASMVDEFYFDTLAIPLVEGRNFRREDDAGAPLVAIVNQQLARHYWPNQDAVGKRLRVDPDRQWVEIVGVARTSKYVFIAEPPSDFVYLPFRQRKPRPGQMTLVAHTGRDPSALAAPLREVVRRLDANIPIYNVRTMEQLYSMRATSVFRVLVTVVAAMGLIGLGLSIVGLYGLVAAAAGRRTREIGIRMAVGATHANVLRMMLRQGMLLSAVGLLAGLAGSIAAGMALLSAFPTGDDGRDPVALVLIAPVVVAVTMLAAYIPARRAARINPMEALRYE